MDNFHVAIVTASFHCHQMALMVQIAQRALADWKLSLHSVVDVPGAYEIPLAAKRLLQQENIAGIIVLGLIEQGETAHGLTMGQSVSHALIQLQLEFMKPMGLGIIGPNARPDQFKTRFEDYAKSAVAALALMLGQTKR